MNGAKFVVSRKWHEDVIKHEVVFDDNGVSIAIEAEEILRFMIVETRKLSRIDLMQRDKVAAKMREAFYAAIDDMKKSTAKTP